MDPQDEEIIDDESEIEDDSDMEGENGDDLIDEEDKNRAQAFSVKNQLVVWDMLINSRIKLQKALLNSNKLPQHDQFQRYMSIGGDQLKKVQSKAMEEERKLMESLAKLSDIIDLKKGKSANNSDPVKHVDNPGSEKYLSNNHSRMLSSVNGIMDDWWQKTNYATRSNKSNAKSMMEGSTSIIESINLILTNNRDRLVKKTQTKRSDYQIVGKDDGIEDQDNDDVSQNIESKQKRKEETIDCEIFDDDDLYGQLLRQLIESKTSLDSVDPISLSRQWLEVQKLRKKMKRRIDTRASKGRRLRYQIHQPLIAFMAPIETCPYDDDAKDALFSSLFSQKKDQTTDS